MPDAPVPVPSPDQRPADRAPIDYSDRRKNLALRELIDEMLASIRVATARELWTPEERAQYEQELAVIMTRVRGEAVRRVGTNVASPAASPKAD